MVRMILSRNNIVASLKQKLLSNKRRLWVALFSFLVILGLGIIIYSVYIEKPSTTVLVNKLNTYSGSNQYSKMISTILAQPSDVQHSLAVQEELARAYTSEKNYSAAYQIYNAISQKTPQNGDSDEQLAQEATLANNKQAAIYWYEKAEKALSKSDPTYQNDEQYMQFQINQLSQK
jgi:hypothetical protein